MAHEMKMPLAQLNVMVGIAKLERIGKTDQGFRPLLEIAKNFKTRPNTMNVHPNDILASVE